LIYGGGDEYNPKAFKNLNPKSLLLKGGFEVIRFLLKQGIKCCDSKIFEFFKNKNKMKRSQK